MLFARSKLSLNVGGGGLPELPDVDTPEVPDVHGSLDVSSTLEAWAHAMGDLAAHVSGALSAMLSVAKIPYRDAADGISLTASLLPEGLGRVAGDRVNNLVGVLDTFFGSTGYHMNINVLNRETLMDAMEHPEKYPSLTIRVSGYAVNFVRLTREQQMDVINRTFHG